MSINDVKDLLFRALQCDSEKRLLESQHLYEAANAILKEYAEGEDDAQKQQTLSIRIAEYSNRIEEIKRMLQQNSMEQSKLLQNRSIDENSTGHSYKSIFGEYLNDDVREVLLEEPYFS